MKLAFMKGKFLIWLLLFISSDFVAQELLPFVENFTKTDYKGDNQVWNLTQGEDKAFYFANNHYLLRYDGVKWERYSLPNKTIIRSVFAHQDKIYCGSYNEFGYWKREKGKMQYFSLSKGKNFFKGSSKNEEIWKIFRANNKLYFQSFNELYICENQTIRKVEIPFLISYCYVIDEQIYVASVNKGVYLFDGKQFTLLSKWDAIYNNVIHGIDRNQKSTYIFTLKNGVFVEQGNGLTEWQHPLNTILKKEGINAAQFYKKDQLVIGTVSNGVYIVQLKTGDYIKIDRNNGLSNNTILTISVDQEKDIWLGLDNGISHLEINSPFRIFSDKTGELGSVYAISSTPNGYLLGSNHGVFTYQNKQLEFLNGSQGQVWNIQQIGQQYIIGHNEGTFLLDKNDFKKVNPLNGGWQLKRDIAVPRFIQSNYLGIAFFSEQDNFTSFKRLNTVYRPIKDFIQTGPNEIVASDSYRGLFKIKYDQNLEVVSYVNLTEKNRISNDFGVKIFQYKSEVLYYIHSEWYVLDHVTDVLKKHELFNKHFKGISEIIPIDDSSFGILKDNLLYIINQNEQHFSWKLIAPKYYEGKIVNNDTRIFNFNHQYLLNLDDGFLLFETNKNDFTKQSVTIEAYLNGELIENETKIPYNQTLELHFLSDFYGNKKTTLFYRQNESVLIPLTEGKLALNNLASGQNKIEIFYTNGVDYVKANEFTFYVKKPWYLSFWMIVLYLTFIGLILFIYYRWNKIRYQEKLKLKEEELKHHKQIVELELEAENKLKIQDYEKHILEMQIQSKASELAGKSLSIAKQGEMIESIKRILENENEMLQLKSKIRKVIKVNALNKKEWESFEKNIYQSHDDFVQRLTKRFPQLTSKDIRLCIYLKMNLSSKEIAPLMNISYRGVELHRYRLRKKITLDADVNLSTFMINL